MERAPDRIEVSEFAQLLEKRRRELLDRAGVQRAELSEQTDIKNGIATDEEEEAAMDVTSDFLLQLGERDRKELTQIRNAFVRIRRGEYGVCENCEQPIELKRLRALPQTPYCQECQSGFEARQKTISPNPHPSL